MSKDRENSRRITEKNEQNRQANRVKQKGGTKFVMMTLAELRQQEALEAARRREFGSSVRFAWQSVSLEGLSYPKGR